MSHNIEFVRGEQKNFIRLAIDDETLRSYEFQMFTHNQIKGFLPFQKRTQNGKTYLYYDVSGTQSLDILGQTQKLQRDFLMLFAKEVLKLYKNVKEYMLSVGGVVFEAKFLMYKVETKEILFIYSFEKGAVPFEALNGFLEYCIDYLDYSDKRLSDCIFRLYEHLQDQRENFSLETELANFLRNLGEGVERAETGMPEVLVQTVEPFEAVLSASESEEIYEDGFGGADRKRRRGILLFLVVDVLAVIIWKPLTLLKLCFFFSLGGCLLGLYIYAGKKAKRNQEKRADERRMQEEVYQNEYDTIASKCDDEEGTKFIALEHVSGALYNLQGIEPQYIYITEKLQVLGKDKEKVQVCILAEGISRVHASIIRKGDACYLEDLCSTNGTYVNGKNIGARTPYLLKEGDRVNFAGTEYIFQ